MDTVLNYRDQVPYAVSDALDKIVRAIGALEAENQALKQQLASLPAPLTLQQISQGLSANGAAPLNLTGLAGK